MNELQKLMNDLILPQALPVLREACVMPALVATDYSAEAQEQNATINVPMPQDFGDADDFDPNTGTTATGLNGETVEIKLDKWKYKAFTMNDKEMRETLTGGVLPSAVEAAVKSIANSVNRDLFDLYKDIPYFAGTAGTPPADEDAVLDAREVLQNNLVPQGDRRLVFGTKAEKNFLKAMKDASKTGTTAALREASLGRLYGLDTFADQMAPVHTHGTAATDTLAVNGGAAAGATVIGIDGGAGTETLLKGDVFTIAGVAGQYVVTEDVAAVAGAFAQVKIYPALAGAAANDAAVTVVAPVSGGKYGVNLAFHRNAFMWAARTLSNEQSETSTIAVQTDPVTGIPLRLETWREPGKSKRFWRFDILYGVKTVRRELAARLHG